MNSPEDTAPLAGSPDHVRDESISVELPISAELHRPDGAVGNRDVEEPSSFEAKQPVEHTATGTPTSSIPAAVFNYVNSIIGAGIIGLPFALREAGFGAGALLLVAIAAMTSYSVQLIVQLGVKTNQLDYERLCEV